MIGALEGEVLFKKTNSFVLMVNGVGYKIFVTQNILDKIQIKKKELFYIYTHVREDILNLYGFKKADELDIFELLISVSGIGPKTAILVIDRGVDNIKQAISTADVSFFTTIPRLGKKNSQKIIIELKNKLDNLVDLDLRTDIGSETNEIISALKQMGFTQSEIIESLKKIPKKALTVEQKIRETLKLLGK
jgi:holliday junction DNA helicase RuvA